MFWLGLVRHIHFGPGPARAARPVLLFEFPGQARPGQVRPADGPARATHCILYSYHTHLKLDLHFGLNYTPAVMSCPVQSSAVTWGVVVGCTGTCWLGRHSWCCGRFCWVYLLELKSRWEMSDSTVMHFMSTGLSLLANRFRLTSSILCIFI